MIGIAGLLRARTSYGGNLQVLFTFNANPSGSKGASMKSKIFLVAKTWAVLASLFSVAFLYAQHETYAISGTLVTPRGIVDDGIILISHGAIEGIGSKIPIPHGTPVIDTNGVIFPGLIDLHNHLVWNVFPRWGPPSPVGNRYDWQAMPDYAAKL